jgi:hypothetical protein
MSGAELNSMPQAAKYRRPPEVVMKLARMGSFHQSRLSFMRVLLRRLKKSKPAVFHARPVAPTEK